MSGAAPSVSPSLRTARSSSAKTATARFGASPGCAPHALPARPNDTLSRSCAVRGAGARYADFADHRLCDFELERAAPKAFEIRTGGRVHGETGCQSAGLRLADFADLLSRAQGNRVPVASGSGAGGGSWGGG